MCEVQGKILYVTIMWNYLIGIVTYVSCSSEKSVFRAEMKKRKSSLIIFYL